MRRADRKTTPEKAAELLLRCEYGLLSCVSPENTPYSVPVNYVYIESENAIYIHCATEGKKLDCIANNPNVQFTAIGKADLLQGFSMDYESVVAVGDACLVENDVEKRLLLIELCEKYYPGTKSDEKKLEGTVKYIEKYLQKTAIIKICVKSVTGKARS